MKTLLYFQDNYGTDRFVTAITNKEDIIPTIQQYAHSLNPKFKIFYIRSWKENDKTWYDVGSHSEFFFTQEVEN